MFYKIMCNYEKLSLLSPPLSFVVLSALAQFIILPFFSFTYVFLASYFIFFPLNNIFQFHFDYFYSYASSMYFCFILQKILIFLFKFLKKKKFFIFYFYFILVFSLYPRFFHLFHYFYILINSSSQDFILFSLL